MPKYKVYLEELATYEVEVEADNEHDAEDMAEYRFTEEGCAKFPVEVHQREASNVELLADEPTQQPEE